MSVAQNCDPRELTPLDETIDTDALDDKLRAADTEMSVKFYYAGTAVRLHGDGTAVVRSEP